MQLLTFDIETAPTSRALEARYVPEDNPAPGNYKTPEAVAGHHARAESSFAEGLAKTASLNPRLGRIVCIGVGGKTWADVDEANEPALIAVALKLIAEQSNAHVVTVNGKAFDFRFLFLRAAMLGVEINLPCKPDDYVRKYLRDPHIDLMEVLNGSRPEKGDSLEGWAQAFGIDTSKVGSGADIWPAVQRGDSAFISAHCAADLSITAQLAAKLDAAGMLR